MPDIIEVGLDHKNTPLELRERLAFQPKRLPDALNQLTESNGTPSNPISEATILSTCNRVEVYAVVKDREAGKKQITSFLSRFHQVPEVDFVAHLRERSNLSVVEHLFSVVSGIDSMILGENQIQRQVKEAFEYAQRFGTTGLLLTTLFQNALTVGKRVRRETAISQNALSIGGAAVCLVQQFHRNLPALKVLVVGVGEMGLITVKNLHQSGVRDITIINRTHERLQSIAQQFEVKTFGFEKLEACLSESDVVVMCTGAPHTVLTAAEMNRIQANSDRRPLLVIDIAVPRDVEPEVSELDGVKLVNIDQIKQQIDTNLQQRCDEIGRVRDIINEELARFLSWQHSLQAKPVITKLRQKAEKIREHELERALRRLDIPLSESDAHIVRDLSRRIVNKILHQPLTRLREEAAAGNGDRYTTTVQDLFDLTSPPQS